MESAVRTIDFNEGGTVIGPGRIYRGFLSRVGRARLTRNPRVWCGPDLRVRGIPQLELHPEATLELGRSVTLNSQNVSYHINMYGPVKIVANHAGATISIGDETRVHGSCLHARERIVVGQRCLIAANCQIIDASGHGLCLEHPADRIRSHGSVAPVTIEDDVWLASGVIVLPGALIGRGSVIGAGSVVRGVIPPCSVAAGNPAVVVKQHAP